MCYKTDSLVVRTGKPELLSPHLVWPTGIPSTIQPLDHVSSVSETLPMIGSANRKIESHEFSLRLLQYVGRVQVFLKSP